MKGLFVFFTCLVLLCTDAHAIGRRHRYAGPPRNEAELMVSVLNCLRAKDSLAYYDLFPPLDTFWRMVMHSADARPEVQRDLNNLKEHPTIFIDLDPYYNHTIITRFSDVIRKGEDSGINWPGIVMQRYELEKEGVAHGMEGMQHIAPERFRGYLFVRDMMSSTTFCITITEIQKVKGYFCGGQVLNVLEAHNKDEYIAKERAERKHKIQVEQAEQKRLTDSAKNDNGTVHAARDSLQVSDSAKVAGAAKPVDTMKNKKAALLSVTTPASDDDKNKMRWEVVDRRLYKGLFDDDIAVELYVRYMRDGNGKVTNWDGLYKFGDMQDYVKLEITKAEDGKWMMEEPAGIMELELNLKVYTGSWTNGDNQTGYDVELTQKDLSQAKSMKLDRILDNNAGGTTRNQIILEKPVTDTAAKDTTATDQPKDSKGKEEEEAKPRKRRKNDEDKATKAAKRAARKRDED